ncbi:hypothetical protein WH50_10515 [Pokkaliibacter plantistimulans]|uniref:Thioredoxin domain-containing protein n=2 Tax=Pokkaliibacter plantistimulans TaxID=1635171 RepID=A0ABX5M374_9GAMM|nr:hypothetical protein WH50_10515 [Pokkaliibacter plantistimulans]
MTANNQAPGKINGFWVVFLILLCIVSAAIGYEAYVMSRPKGEYGNLGGDFTLQGIDGPVSLSNFKGKVVVLYFGYTSCPDVCPTSLATLGQAIRLLPKDEQNDVQGIFVSVDPERDNLQKLADYSRFFYPTMIGITGQDNQLQALARQYGAFYRRVELKDSAMGYAMDHTSSLYLINKDGVLSKAIHHGSTPDQIKNSIQALL